MPLIQSVIECEHSAGVIVAESADTYWIRCNECHTLFKLNRAEASKRKLIRGVVEHRYSKRILDGIEEG